MVQDKHFIDVYLLLSLFNYQIFKLLLVSKRHTQNLWRINFQKLEVIGRSYMNILNTAIYDLDSTLKEHTEQVTSALNELVVRLQDFQNKANLNKDFIM